jgi:hypothetical protein
MKDLIQHFSQACPARSFDVNRRATQSLIDEINALPASCPAVGCVQLKRKIDKQAAQA